MTYQDAVAFLEAVTNYERTPDPSAMREVRLERMRRLCELVGNPQRQFRAILVGGTSGKGSICSMIYAMLRAAGLRVGLYVSPHLEDPRERIRVSAPDRAPSSELDEQADWISPEALASSLQHLHDVLRGKPELPGHGPLTYFELLTAAAFVHFAHQRVEVGVFEVGLGGRLDATNVLDPVVSVLAPIGLDHTDVLGHDLVTIAKEKAGIIRPASPVISATQHPSVSSMLRDLTTQQQCPLVEYGQQFSATIISHRADGLRLAIHAPRSRHDQLSLPLCGRHQAENAAVAVATIESLANGGSPYSAIRTGLAHLQWPGRVEVIQERPLVVLDGAHNAPSAYALRATLEELWPGHPKHLLLGMSRDKALSAIANVFGPIARSVTCTASRHPRAADPQQLAEQWPSASCEVGVIPDAVDALTYVLNSVDPDEMIVVTGSLFLVGQLRSSIRHALTNHRRRTSPQGAPPHAAGHD